eukprot:TRINITY_DN35191_c0_g1_i1.p1 TRINITY_DN35191_c0_g1~~TRINITY_DN35191_c0_g1_i1.p1  ORF type:complete len:170 (-),score=15.67 TRINITY_DN35191_c0_g1_i1:91-600(-)
MYCSVCRTVLARTSRPAERASLAHIGRISSRTVATRATESGRSSAFGTAIAGAGVQYPLPNWPVAALVENQRLNKLSLPLNTTYSFSSPGSYLVGLTQLSSITAEIAGDEVFSHISLDEPVLDSSIGDANEAPAPILCRKKIWRKRGRAKMGWVSSKSSRRVANKGTCH